jgi:hypothetical protein
MKNILTIALIFLASLTFAQNNETVTPINIDSLMIVPPFSNHSPELTLYGINNSFQAATLLQEQLDLTERLDLYRKKRNNRMILGTSLMAAGGAGIWYVAEMNEPLFWEGDSNDPELIAHNKEAQDQKDLRRYIAWPSALIGLAGAVIFVDSFKFNKWTKLELGVANVKITQELYGLSTHRRKYFTEKESELKKKSIYRKSYPRYHK